MPAAAGAVAKMTAFFTTCSSDQINELMQVLQETQANNATAGSPDAVSKMTVKAGVTPKKIAKKPRNKKAKVERATGGPKRPLNSWMAFRKWYSVSLAGSTQKTISRVLTIMWAAEPFGAKW